MERHGAWWEGGQSLRGRSVLVTGASAGIGRACVRRFARAGCAVAFCARRRERLEELLQELEGHPGPFHAFALDVRDREAVFSTLAGLPGPFRVPDILVNNAGLSRGLEPVHEGSVDDWEEMIDTNLKGLLYVTRALTPGMVERGSGHLIQIGSIAGREAYAGGNVYNASKHAVLGLTRAMRLDLVPHGLRVSTVDPGLVDTEFSTVRFHGDRERADATYHGMTPLTAADVAETVFLVAAAPAHVNLAEVLVLPADQASCTVVRRHGS